MKSFSPAHAAWLRYSSALLAFFLAILVLGGSEKIRKRLFPPFFRPRSAKDFACVFAIGFSAFCFSPLLQMTGLSGTRAVDNALIVAMEPLMTVLLAWMILREKLHRVYAVSMGLALVGFGFLAEIRGETFTHGWDLHLWSNLILLISLSGEAAYSVFGRKLVERFPPTAVFGSSLLFGVSLLTAVTAFRVGLPSFDEVLHPAHAESLLALLWLGPLGTALSYLYWMIALVEAPVTSLALTLFVQPVMGAFWGFLFLDERLSVMQGVGGGLILFAVILPTAYSRLFSGETK